MSFIWPLLIKWGLYFKKVELFHVSIFKKCFGVVGFFPSCFVGLDLDGHCVVCSMETVEPDRNVSGSDWLDIEYIPFFCITAKVCIFIYKPKVWELFWRAVFFFLNCRRLIATPPKAFYNPARQLDRSHFTPEISLRKSFQSLLIAFNCSSCRLQSHSEPTRKPLLWAAPEGVKQEVTLCPAAAANEISINAAVAAVQSEH